MHIVDLYKSRELSRLQNKVNNMGKNIYKSKA